uniref:PLAT domain-containing protein n=1 Tax=Panagrellus redivivus TaxID=6233 RepID=A0A7E4VQJ4_PANRE
MAPTDKTDTDETSSLRSNSAENTDVDDRCCYSIVVRTSSDEHTSTDGSVFVQLTDAKGNSTSKCRLNCSISHRKKFQRAHSDLFVLTEQNRLEDLKFVDVWLRPRQTDGISWKLHSVNVIEHVTHKLYRFPCGNWLNDDSDEQAHVRIEVAGLPFDVMRDQFFDVTQ